MEGDWAAEASSCRAARKHTHAHAHTHGASGEGLGGGSGGRLTVGRGRAVARRDLDAVAEDLPRAAYVEARRLPELGAAARLDEVVGQRQLDAVVAALGCRAAAGGADEGACFVKAALVARGGGGADDQCAAACWRRAAMMQRVLHSSPRCATAAAALLKDARAAIGARAMAGSSNCSQTAAPGIQSTNPQHMRLFANVQLEREAAAAHGQQRTSGQQYEELQRDGRSEPPTD